MHAVKGCPRLVVLATLLFAPLASSTTLMEIDSTIDPSSFYLGCFEFADAGNNKRGSMTFDHSRLIASPTTAWKEYDSALNDVEARSLAGTVPPGWYAEVTTGREFIVVSTSGDMVPAGLQFCQDKGSKYAAFYNGGGTVVCGDNYGRKGSVSESACMPADAKTWNGVSIVTKNADADSVCEPNAPCGGTVTGAAVYATTSAQWIENPSYDATKAAEWLKTLDYSTLDSMKGGDYADVIVTFTSSTLGMTEFELKLSGNDATDYCTTMRTDDGVQGCRVQVTTVEKEMTTACGSCAMFALSQAQTESDTLVAMHTEYFSGSGIRAFVDLKKIALCSVPHAVGEAAHCINSKQCTPSGICAVNPNYRTYGTSNMQGQSQSIKTALGLSCTTTNPNNYAAGTTSEDTGAKFHKGVLGTVAYITAALCKAA